MSNMSDDVRLAKFDDVKSLNALIVNCGGAPYMKAMFGTYNFPSLLESSNISLVYQNQKFHSESITAYLSLSDSALLFDFALDETLALLHECIEDALPVNSLFVNFFAIDENKKSSRGQDLFYSAFSMYPELEYIFWLYPKSVIQSEIVSKLFIEVESEALCNHLEPKNVRALMLRRSTLLPALNVREARIEDNDDIVPILRQCSPSPKDYDDFFLADLLMTDEGKSKFFVGVTNDRAVGFLSISTDVNLSLLNSVFDFSQYPALLRNQSVNEFSVPLLVINGLDFNGLTSTVEEVARKLDYLFFKVFETENDVGIMETNICHLSDTVPAINMVPWIKYHLNNAHLQGLTIVGVVIMNDTGRYDNDLFRSFGSTTSILISDSSSIGSQPKAHGNFHYEILLDFKDDSCAIQLEYEFHNLVQNAGKSLKSSAKESACFGITAFTMRQDLTSTAVCLLELAFEKFQDTEYGLYLYPCGSTPHTSHLMTPVPLRPGVSFDQTLFIVHRDTVMVPVKTISFSRMCDDDIIDVKNFLDVTNPEKRETIMSVSKAGIDDNCINMKDNPNDVCFLVKSRDKILSVLNISRRSTSVEEVIWMRANFDIDSHVDVTRHRGRSQAMIQSWSLHPDYTVWGRVILKEAMRIYGKTLLYFKDSAVTSSPSVFLEFLPIKPRRRIQKRRCKDDSKYDYYSNEPADPLYVISKYYLFRPRLKPTVRMLIIGLSTSTISFLENICFRSDVSFRNIAIVTDHLPNELIRRIGDGSEYPINSLHSVDYTLSISDDAKYNDIELKLLGLQNKVQFILGQVSDIDRKNNAVILSSELIIEYDMLLLSQPTQDATVRMFPSTAKLHPSKGYNRGIFGVGNPCIDEKAVTWIKNSVEPDSVIVIYGAIYDAVNVVGKLTKLGIPNFRLKIVTTSSVVEGFGHESINCRVEELLKSHSIQVYFGQKVHDVIFSDGQSVKTLEVVSVKAEADQPHSFIPCNTLLTCNEKVIDFDLLAAVNDAGLVFDGGIVVDENFRTVDQWIFAFGEFSRFSRMHREYLPHSRYNAREIGRMASEKVCKLILKEDYFVSPKSGSVQESSQFPLFQESTSSICVIPDGIIHFQSKSTSKPRESSDYVTGGVDINSPISCLTVSSLGTVCGFSYIGPDDIETRNLSCLVNYHESFLNDAINSYEKGLFSDWISFLREDWADILFHDKFRDLLVTIRSAVKNETAVISMIERVFEIADRMTEDNIVAEMRKKLFGEKCSHISESTRKVIENSILDFIREYKSTLSNYYITQSKSK